MNRLTAVPLVVGTLAAVLLVPAFAPSVATAKPTVINLERVRAKALVRAQDKCWIMDRYGWECIKGTAHTYGCRRESATHRERGWCYSHFVVRSHQPGPSYHHYYDFYARHGGTSTDNVIRWWPYAWSATRLPDA